jgi:hypothetical protein
LHHLLELNAAHSKRLRVPKSEERESVIKV